MGVSRRFLFTSKALIPAVSHGEEGNGASRVRRGGFGAHARHRRVSSKNRRLRACTDTLRRTIGESRDGNACTPRCGNVRFVCLVQKGYEEKAGLSVGRTS